MEKTTPPDLKLMLQKARGLRMTIRSLEDLTSVELKDQIADMIKPDSLLHPDIKPWDNIWSELQKYLGHQKVMLHVQDRRRAVFKLENTLFDDQEEKEFAL